MRRSPGLSLALLAVAGGGLVAGCGQARQDAHEAKGNYTLSVLRASFPAAQTVSSQPQMVLVVKNTGRGTVPNLAVTVDSFTQATTEPGQSNAQRPVWLIDSGPGRSASRPVDGAGSDVQGGDASSYTNTWSAGPLAAGQVATLSWRVTPIRVGMHRVSYRLAAGLNGRARAQTADGQVPGGSFTVNVSNLASASHVDPNTGSVVNGPATQPRS